MPLSNSQIDSNGAVATSEDTILTSSNIRCFYNNDDIENINANTRSRIEIEADIRKAVRERIINNKGFKAKEYVLLIAAGFIAIFSIITNYEFGGSFALRATNYLAAFFKLILTAATLETIRLFFAFDSAVVNWVINTRSISFALPMISNALSEIFNRNTPHRLRKTGILILSLFFVTLAAIANWQMVETSVKDANAKWSSTKELLVKFAVCFAAAMLVYRGLMRTADDLRNSPLARIIPYYKKEQDDAAVIRMKMLPSLVADLANRPQDLTYLSQGYRYDGIPYWRKLWLISTLFIAPTLTYVIAGYLGATDEAMEGVTGFAPLRYFVDFAATSGRALVLCNTATSVAESILNSRARDRLTNTKTKWNILSAILIFTLATIAVLSLTGAEGLVYDYFIPNAAWSGLEYLRLLSAIVIGLWGSGFINYLDVKTLSEKISPAAHALSGCCYPSTYVPLNKEIAAELVAMKPKEILALKPVPKTQAALLESFGMINSDRRDYIELKETKPAIQDRSANSHATDDENTSMLHAELTMPRNARRGWGCCTIV